MSKYDDNLTSYWDPISESWIELSDTTPESDLTDISGFEQWCESRTYE